jgi:hypothetical protein
LYCINKCKKIKIKNKKVQRKQRGIDSTHIKAKQREAKEENNIQNENVDVHANKNRNKEEKKRRDIDFQNTR